MQFAVFSNVKTWAERRYRNLANMKGHESLMESIMKRQVHDRGARSMQPESKNPGVLLHHKQKKSAPQRCTSVAEDANEQAANLTNWQQEYDQLDPGRFHGRIDELHLGDLQLFNEHTGRALRQQCTVWPDSIWFGIPSKREDVRINGQGVDTNDLLCRPGSTGFELVTPEDFDMLSIVVRKEELESHADSQEIELKVLDTSAYPRLKLPERTLKNFRYLLRRIIRPCANQIDTSIHHDLLILALLELLAKEKPNDNVPPSYAHRKAVVERIKEYVAQAGDVPVTMTKLCEIGYTSRRTLQYSFETILGISPMQFLRISRLNRVKRMLSDDPATSVSDAAAFNGFYHHSQFSADYKQLFGESPSQTLARR